MIPIDALPIYLDGSDGSIWASRDTWASICADPDIACRRFVRVSDLLQWLETNRIDTGCPIQKMIDHSKEHFAD